MCKFNRVKNQYRLTLLSWIIISHWIPVIDYKYALNTYSWPYSKNLRVFLQLVHSIFTLSLQDIFWIVFSEDSFMVYDFKVYNNWLQFQSIWNSVILEIFLV